MFNGIIFTRMLQMRVLFCGHWPIICAQLSTLMTLEHSMEAHHWSAESQVIGYLEAYCVLAFLKHCNTCSNVEMYLYFTVI